MYIYTYIYIYVRFEIKSHGMRKRIDRIENQINMFSYLFM